MATNSTAKRSRFATKGNCKDASFNCPELGIVLPRVFASNYPSVQDDTDRVEATTNPNLYAELMESVSRIVGAIALLLVAATIISQLTKHPEELPTITERVQWGAR